MYHFRSFSTSKESSGNILLEIRGSTGGGTDGIYGETALLRSLAVAEDCRGIGYGRLMTERLLKSAEDSGIRTMFLLTTTAEKFFEKYGFVSIARSEADESIKTTAEYKYLCPDNAVVMKKDIES
ncbi:GNAT family N-acetyltransferase [candidate division KSB1 bacterium]